MIFFGHLLRLTPFKQNSSFKLGVQSLAGVMLAELESLLAGLGDLSWIITAVSKSDPILKTMGREMQRVKADHCGRVVVCSGDSISRKASLSLIGFTFASYPLGCPVCLDLVTDTERLYA